jgi:hypothetical protein
MFQLFAQFSNGTGLDNRTTGQVFYKFANSQKVLDKVTLECKSGDKIDCSIVHRPLDESQSEFTFNFAEEAKVQKSTDFYQIFKETIWDHFGTVSGHSMVAMTKLAWVKGLKGVI